MKVLIVEDDQHVASLIRDGLAADAHTVELAQNGSDASFLGRTCEYDAIVLDYSLPKKDGLTVCKEIRSAGKHTPIIFLSVNGESETKLQAFHSGADDYVIKPFSLQELYARLQAVARRPALIKDSVLKVHDLTLDTVRHIVTRGHRRIHLTNKEYALLEFLMKNSGIMLSRALIMEHVWTADSSPFSNTVEAHIRNVRKKINAGNRPDLITNLAGRGYIMDTPENIRKL